MGKVTGFMEIPRELPTRRPVDERLRDWQEVYRPFPLSKLEKQGARCMDCAIPFCHQGCPLGNLIPDWNDLVYRNNWREALDRLHATNNFPEFTGRLCPAPCEASCVLGINADPVTIKLIEQNIIDRAWDEGWVKPEPPATLTGKKIVIVGSGPAGLAAAQQLRRVGHEVTVFERADRVGGLLRFGIPEFKMEKRFLDRRVSQMEAEGVIFKTNAYVGVNVDVDELRKGFDAVLLAGGATQARDLPIPGRELKGIYQAIHYLPMGNRFTHGDVKKKNGQILAALIPPYGRTDEPVPFISAKGKRVIIIGGGDTGADCLGTVHRQGCKSVLQLEIVPRPPDQRAPNNPWPQWPNILRVSSAHEEGGGLEFQINTKEFLGDENGNLRALRTVRVNMEFKDGRLLFREIPGTEETIEADLVLLAMGFLGPERSGMLEQMGVEMTPQGNVKADQNKMTSVEGIFTAGDMTRGQSLIVWAITEGRHAAHGIDQWLMGQSDLPKPLEHGNQLRPFA